MMQTYRSIAVIKILPSSLQQVRFLRITQNQKIKFNNETI